MVDAVAGIVLLNPPIFRMSCSLPRLWMNDPEHRNNNALKNECVDMCRNANIGWFSPIIVIINPNWLVVDRAMIFLISCCVIAEAAANIVVSEPIIRHAVSAVLLFCITGCRRIRRNTPATTIVLECSSADTGVGPSMAAGNHGCSPNWADFPIAAAMRPMSGIILIVSCCVNISCMFIDVDPIIHAVVIMRPISPIRL